MVVSLVAGVAGSFVGGWFQQGRLKKKHDKEKKDLLKYIQSIDDVYKSREQQWQAEYQKLYKAYESLETDSIKRDYEEFKAPDTDGDDKVSREEFAIYVRKYLSSFPELSEKDFPQFDDFDLDNDGIVSFAEWQQVRFRQVSSLSLAHSPPVHSLTHPTPSHPTPQHPTTPHPKTKPVLKQQKLKEAQGGGKGGGDSAYGDLLNALYQDTYTSDSFEALDRKTDAARKGTQGRRRT